MLARSALRNARLASHAKNVGQVAKVCTTTALSFPSAIAKDSLQRSNSSSTQSASSSQLSSLAAACAAVAAGAGAIGSYYYVFGNELHAMTPQEEGYDDAPFRALCAIQDEY